MLISKLLWDDWNISHIARHDVTPDEVEEVCQGRFLASSTYQHRIRLIGLTDKNKMLTIILARKTENEYYPVTARPARKDERKLYAREKG